MFKEYVRYLRNQKGYSENTINAYLTDLEEFFDNITKAPKDVKRIDIMNHINFLKETKLNSSSTTNRKLTSIRNYFRFLVITGKIENNPASEIETARTPKRLPKPLTTRELNAISNVYDGNDEKSLRNKAIIETMYALGLRCEEVVNLKINNIDFENMFVRIIGKGNKERINPISDYALNLIKQYLSIRKIDSEYVFPNPKGDKMTNRAIGYIIKNASKIAGVNRISVSPHKIRHTFATDMLNNGAEIKEVQELLGHADISTTQGYAELCRQRLFERYRKINSIARSNIS